MLRAKTAVATLADRLCRPQRIGVFGHRAVGKTTLLTMLYREAVAGRLPGVRLAAADARTANYVSDKILQLESGQPVPGTLAETELRFHLYRGSTRIELLVKDYQGEHTELGRENEAIREFLRDCDAVWLCFDAAKIALPAERLRRQQEAEQLIEDYLAVGPQASLDRPVALVLTKADLAGPMPHGDEHRTPGEAEWLENLSMARHALQTHCPNRAVLPVSSLGRPQGPVEHAVSESPLSPAPCPLTPDSCPLTPALRPYNLNSLLAWLVDALQTQDEARMEQLWAVAGGRLPVLERCFECFAHRYPDAPATATYRQSLRELQRRRRRRRGLLGAAAAACLAAGLWSYDALGYQNTARFEAAHAEDPSAVLRRWQDYRLWHPTRNLLRPGDKDAEEARLHELHAKARQDEYARQLTELRRQAEDPDTDAEALWPHLHDLCEKFPEMDTADVMSLRAGLKSRRDEQIARRALLAYDEFALAEQRSANLIDLVARADRFLQDFPGSALEPDARRLREAYLLRLDERDLEPARAYSARQPFDFAQRLEQYQRYLDKHPGGQFAHEAQAALRSIAAEWDRHDFRAVRDHFEARPGDVPELVTRCRTYLAVHPHGRFTEAATELLRWSERVTAPREYRVKLHGGEFEHDIARLISRGPKLSVGLEVNGVTFGPSTIVYNRYDPVWDYEFSRPVRWKLGDEVRIWVIDHTWKDRVVFGVASGDDPLAMRWLSGEVWSGKNHLTFESDFALPVLPKVE